MTNVVKVTIFTIHENLDCDGNLQLVGMDCIGPDNRHNTVYHKMAGKLFDYYTFELNGLCPHPHNENFRGSIKFDLDLGCPASPEMKVSYRQKNVEMDGLL